MDYTQRPDYARVVDITTRAALRQMVAPGLVAVATPILVGLLLGYQAVAGLLMVGTIAGVMLATVLNNGGGAWDNAKKYIESGHLKDDDGNVLGKEHAGPRRGGRRRHGRGPVQGHRRPVAPRAGQAAGHHHPGPRSALHPLDQSTDAGAAAHAAPDHRPTTLMDIVFQAIVIGIIQGLTEFIPVSSSAHLELAPWIFGWDQDRLISSLAFDVFLHLGTLLALLVYFGRDWLRLLGAVLASIRERRIGLDADRRLGWLLVLATIPAAIIGFVGEDLIDEAFHGDSDEIRLAIAGSLVVGAIILVAADRLGAKRREIEQVGPGTSLAIGFSQALALLPGISRSGATISAGLALGLTRESAARFSFLLATPITLGAGLYGSRHLLDESHTATEWLALGAGFAAAAIAGLLAIGFLLAWLRRRSFLVFSIYRVALAALVVALVMAGR